MNAEEREKVNHPSRLKQASMLLAAALFVLYPVFVYYAIQAGNVRRGALLLFLIYLPLGVARLLWGKRSRLGGVQLIPLLTLGAIALSYLFSEAGLLLITPTLINWSLLLVFAATLFTDRPMIERFARLIDPNLGKERQRWCSLWTYIWCGFFALNGGVALLLAMLDERLYWTGYTSIVSYVLMGLLLGGEMALRYLRFGSLREGSSG